MEIILSTRTRTGLEFPKGPARFAFILQGEKTFSIFRRFEWLTTYWLLEKQTSLMGLEKRARDLYSNTGDGLELDKHEKDFLLQDINTAMTDYARLVEIKRQLTSYDRPPGPEYNSMLNLLQTDPEHVGQADYTWLFETDDLMVLTSQRDKTLLANGLKRLIVALPTTISKRLPVRVDSVKIREC